MRENAAIRERLSNAIGLQRIWAEGAQVERLTPRSLFIRLAIEALRSIAASPLTSLLTLFTIVTVLFVFGAFLLVVENLDSFLKSTQTEVTMSVFLRDGIADTEVRRLTGMIKDEPAVKEVNYQTKDQALASFQASVGSDSPLVSGLDKDNPLPASLEVSFQQLDQIEEEIERLGERLKGDAAVEHVEYSRGFLNRLASVLRAIRYGGAVGVCVMVVLTGFLIMVTIRLALYSHREEIEIMYLVGATKWFVRAPYMVEGFLQGILGAVLGLGLLYGAFRFLVSASAEGGSAAFVLASAGFLSPGSVITVVFLGMLVGTIGAFLAVRKFLLTVN